MSKNLDLWMVQRAPNRTQRLSHNLRTVLMFVNASTKKEALEKAMEHPDFGFKEERSEQGVRTVLDYKKPTASLVAPGGPFFL